MKKLSLPHVLSLAVAAVCVAVPGYAETDFSGSPAEATAFPAGMAAEDDILTAADISAPEPAPAAAQPADGVYIIPDDVRCYVRKEDRVTFCTDHDGAPINGEMRKYREDELIRTYPLKDGVLNGTAVSYYISGGILAEKPIKAVSWTVLPKPIIKPEKKKPSSRIRPENGKASPNITIKTAICRGRGFISTAALTDRPASTMKAVSLYTN